MASDVLIAVCLLIGGAGYLGMAWYVWQRRARPGSTALLLSLFACFVWTTAYAIELTTRTPEAGSIWSTVKYFGIVLLPPALLAFIAEYTGRGRHLTPRAYLLLAIEPIIVMTLLIVPSTHELLLVYDAAHKAELGTPWWPPKAGPLFWPHAVYSYVLSVGALGLMLVRLSRLASPYRRPAWVVTVAAILPIIGNIAYNLDLTNVDPTPFLFSLMGVVLVWGFFTMGLIELAPIARGRVIEQMSDCVLVLDAYHRVIDANPATGALLGVAPRHVIGRYAAVLLPPLADLINGPRTDDVVHTLVTLPAPSGPGSLPGVRALAATGAEAVIHVDVQFSVVTDRSGAEAGRLLVLRDITQRIRTEQQLRELVDSQAQTAAVLQTSLRPASLPSVPRVRLSARSQPARLGEQVSGDFYDVHQTLGGDWAFVLGDVAGKGVGAAVITSMARYTVRTLSAQGWSPKQVIEQLNQALLAEAASERFCTVAYCRISPIEDPGAAQDGPIHPLRDRPGSQDAPSLGVNLTIALGGHPAPLVRRTDGRIEAIGRSGTALGIVAAVDIEEVHIQLAPGELLVAFTDGVTEARRGGVEFGEERLAWTMTHAASGLHGRTGPAVASLLADAVADRVMEAVNDYAEHRDDIAVLVLAVS